MNFTVLNPPALQTPRGWNHGMLAAESGRVLFVAGQTGHDGAGALAAVEFTEQFERALVNVLEVVRAAGGKGDSIARFTIYVTDMEGYRRNTKVIGEAYRRHMGRHYPAMTLVAVTALVDPEAKVEIEATAVLP